MKVTLFEGNRIESRPEMRRWIVALISVIVCTALASRTFSGTAVPVASPLDSPPPLPHLDEAAIRLKEVAKEAQAAQRMLEPDTRQQAPSQQTEQQLLETQALDVLHSGGNLTMPMVLVLPMNMLLNAAARLRVQTGHPKTRSTLLEGLAKAIQSNGGAITVPGHTSEQTSQRLAVRKKVHEEERLVREKQQQRKVNEDLMFQQLDFELRACADHKCLNGAACMPVERAYECVCQDGYTGMVRALGYDHAWCRLTHSLVPCSSAATSMRRPHAKRTDKRSASPAYKRSRAAARQLRAMCEP